MQDHDSAGGDRGVIGVRTMEAIVASALAALGAVVMYKSHRLGAGWSATGPESGYFPFYVGLLLLGASLGALLTGLFGRTAGRGAFVSHGQLRLVLQILIPTAAFVLAIAFLGIYVAGGLFIGLFMRWLGRFGWPQVLPVAVLLPLALFVAFDIWFLIPLPKGPLEAWLGY